MQIKGNFFLIDSFDFTFQIHMFNISPLLNTAKIEKKVKMRSKLMKHFLIIRKDTTVMDVITNCVGYLCIEVALHALKCRLNCFS